MVQQLNFPNSDVEFTASPALFLGPFDVYDREDSLGQDLNAYDPNDPAQLRQLLDVYFFPAWAVNVVTVAHKLAIASSLTAALQEPNYNFSSFFENDDGYFSLPSAWDIRDPRQFFYGVFLALIAHWGEELRAAGHSLPSAEGLGMAANNSFKPNPLRGSA